MSPNALLVVTFVVQKYGEGAIVVLCISLAKKGKNPLASETKFHQLNVSEAGNFLILVSTLQFFLYR